MHFHGLVWGRRWAQLSINARPFYQAGAGWQKTKGFMIGRQKQGGTQMGDEGAVAAALTDAQHVQHISVQNQRFSAVPLELRATIGDAGAGRLTLYSTCQKPHTLRQVLAGAVFQRPETDFHIICPDVGGGFGQRGTVYPEDALVLWASEKLGRPVKWVGKRSDNLTNDAHARDQTDEGEMAFDGDGRITALRVTLTTNLGSYQTISAMVSSLRAAVNMSSVYAIPAIHVTVCTAFTHTAPLGPYGGGLPEAVHFIECMMDDAAVALGLDAAEIRRRNLIQSAAMPIRRRCNTPTIAANSKRLWRRRARSPTMLDLRRGARTRKPKGGFAGSAWGFIFWPSRPFRSAWKCASMHRAG